VREALGVLLRDRGCAAPLHLTLLSLGVSAFQRAPKAQTEALALVVAEDESGRHAEEVVATSLFASEVLLPSAARSAWGGDDGGEAARRRQGEEDAERGVAATAARRNYDVYTCQRLGGGAAVSPLSKAQ
ncbi:hypothetical protein T484DRAFT_1654696, partial [Baffinella frigidus]